MLCWVKCPTSCSIPYLAGQRPKSYKAERKTVISYFAKSQMPFVLVVHIVTVFLCVLRTLMMGSLKIHSCHVQRGDEWCCSTRLSCRASLGDWQRQKQQGQQ